MGLNRLTRKALAFYQKSLKQLPLSKTELHSVCFEFHEMLEDIMYEDRKENNNRYPLYENNVKIHSILISMNKIANYKMAVDKEKYVSEFLTRLNGLEYRIN